MTGQNTNGRFELYQTIGRHGSPEAVDLLMAALAQHDDLAATKLVDFALGLIDTQPGRARIRHYLFNGQAIQRNYAALYFKRLGFDELLEEVVRLGLVDQEQAFAK